MMNKQKIENFLLRMGLAFVFLYAGISIITNPSSWVGFVPRALEKFLSVYTILYLHAALDLFLGIWLVYGKKLFYASILCILNLSAIIFFNLNSLDILFRDIGLLFASIVLAIISYGNNKIGEKNEKV